MKLKNILALLVKVSVGFVCLNAYAADPIINNTPPTEATIGSTYTYQIDAHDPDGTTLSYTLLVPLEGMTISSTGLISWTPTSAELAGLQFYRFLVSDEDDETAGQQVNLSVSDPNNTSPAYVNEPILEAQIDTLYEYNPQFTDADGDTLSYSLFTSPANDNITLSAQGLLRWQPSRADLMHPNIRITANDGRLGITTVAYSLRVVDPNNTAPVFNSSPSLTAFVGTEYRYTADASDAEGDAIRLLLPFSPEGMSLDTSTNTIIWTPTATGVYKVIVAAKDAFDEATKQIFNITVLADDTGNIAPTATSASVATLEEQALAIQLQANDPEGAALSYTVTAPSNGTLSGTAPNLTYTPNAEYNGSDSFTFTVSDGELSSNVATIDITVSSVNDVPIANDQAVITDEDQSIAITLTGSDAETTQLSYTLLSQPLNGSVIGTAPDLVYEPNADFFGDDSFTFTVSDGIDTSNVATVSITINAINDAPTASDLTINTDEDVSVLITLAGADVDSASLSYSIESQPSNGALSASAATITYSPLENFNGVDQFSYRVNDGELNSTVATVSLTINAVNDAPVADDLVIQLNEDATAAITLTAVDADADPVSYQVVEQPGNGLLIGDLPNITYVPNNHYFGADQLTYRANDGAVDSALATVSIDVLPVNDSPEFASEPIAEVVEGGLFQHTVIVNDVDNDDIEITVTTVPTIDDLIFNAATNEITWQTVLGDHGEYQIIITASDGIDTSTQQTDITVAVGNLAITSTPPASIEQNAVYTYNIEVAQPDPSQLLSFVNNGFSENVTLDAQAQVLSWQTDDRFLLGDSTLNPYCSIYDTSSKQPIDMSNWTVMENSAASGGSITQTWHVSEGGFFVRGEGNGPASFFVSDFEVSEAVIEFDITVDAERSDDDGIGFVWGYQEDFNKMYRLSWTAFFQTRDNPTLNVSKTDRNADGSDDNGETFFRRRPFRWVPGVDYRFYLDTRGGKSSIHVLNNDTGEMVDVIAFEDATFPKGRIGFYAGSQNNINMRASFIQQAPAADLTISSLSYAQGEITASVINRGAVATAEATSIELIAGNFDAEGVFTEDLILPTASIPVLSPGEVFDVVIAADLDPAQYTTLQAVVDPQISEGSTATLIAECTEQNNLARVPLFSVSVSDESGQSDQQIFSVQVLDVNEPPQIIVDPELIANAGEVNTITIAGFDPDVGDYLINEIISGPVNASFSLEGDNITWRPRADQAGETVDITVRYTDLQGEFTEQTIPIYVNSRPRITSEPGLLARRLTLYEYQVEAVDDDGDDLSYVFVERPSRMSLNSTTGFLSWQPVNTFNSQDVIFRVIDEHGAYDEQDYDLAILNGGQNNVAPVLDANTPPLTATPLEVYQYTFTAEDPDGYEMLFKLLEAPPNMTIDEDTGQIWWSPPYTTQINHPVIVQVHDQSGGYDTFSYVIRLTGSSGVFPEIISVPPTQANPGEPYEYQVIAVDADSDVLRYALEQSPAAMTISDSGLIRWTPANSQFDPRRVSVNVTDELGNQTAQSYTINLQRNLPPQISSTPNTRFESGVVYFYQVIADDPENDSLQFTADSVAAGVTIDANTGLISWLPDATIQSTEITVTVTDTFGNATLQRYIVSRENNHTPIINSVPEQQVKFGETYTYQVLASDEDNDPLTYTVEPADITVSADGLVSWTPASLSDSALITVRAADPSGSYSEQTFSVSVLANNVPEIVSLPGAFAVSGLQYTYPVLATDIDGDTLEYQLTRAPAAMSIDSISGRITWTPTLADQGIVPVVVLVSDGLSFTEQTYSITVADQAPELALNISVDPMFSDEGTAISAQVGVINAVSETTLSATVDGVAVDLDEQNRIAIVSSGIGEHTIEVTGNDGRGNVVSQAFYYVRDPLDDDQPVAIINLPEELQKVTEPVVVSGTATDSRLLSYSVKYRRKGLSEYTEFNNSTSSVTEGELAVFDPSRLLNGVYDILLEVTDVNGNMQTDSRTVSVDGDLKVGNFSFSVVDMEVPLAGIPIRLTRSYDSRRKDEQLDFGYGWSVDYQDVRVEESRVPGQRWQQVIGSTGGIVPVPTFCTEPVGGAPTVTVILPDGDQEEFSMQASPRCNVIETLTVNLEFTPVGNTQSTLEIIGDRTAHLDTSLGMLVDTSTFSQAVNPNRYRLTTQAGFVYELNQSFGIEQVITPNGHTVTYTDDGIFHSGGKSITFERDHVGRIDRVIDPAGNDINYVYDAADDLINVIDQTDDTVTYVYNNEHALIDILDPLNRLLIKNIYDDVTGQLIAQEDNQGRRTEFDHDVLGRQSVLTDRDGRTTVLDYDSWGNVMREIKAARNIIYNTDIQTDFAYDTNNNEIYSAVGGADYANTMEYDSNNNQQWSRNALGQTILFEDYNSLGQEGRVLDERGHAHDMVYDSAGNLVSITGPEHIDPQTGELTRRVAMNVINPVRGLVDSATDMNGNVTHFTYYETGHPWQDQKHTESTALSGTTTFTYDDNLNVKTETRQRTVNGVVTEETLSYDYDSKNRLTMTTYPDGSYTEIEYDEVGNMVGERNRYGEWTEIDYDLYGRVIATLYPDGSQTSNTYTAEGKLATTTDQNGHVTRHEYDDFGRLWRVHFEPGNGEPATFTETQYTPQGWVQFEWDENRNLTEYTYDFAGRRRSVIRHGEGASFTHSFDYYENGELRSETDALSHTTTYILNELDQRVETQFHNGTTIQAQFDALGTRIREIDQNLRAKRLDYDDLGRLIGVQPEVTINNEAVPLTTYEYDETGNKIAQIDANLNRTEWTYDYFGRVTSRTLPMLQQETTVYDDNARTITHTDFNQQVSTTQRDNMDRIARVDYHDGQFEIFNYWPDGQVQTVETQDGITSYNYYAKGQLQNETRPDGTVMAYQYDAVGNRTQVSVTRDNVTSTTDYTFDDFNRLKTVNDNNGETVYSYDAVGNLDTVTYPNGLITDYDYNSVNQLTRVETRNSQGDVLGGYTYTLEDSGRRDLITEDNGRITDYDYDNLYRLTDEVVTDAANGNYTANYQYDWVGNRTFKTIDGVQTGYSYNNNDWLELAGNTVYGYDDNGNTISEAENGNVTNYHYDAKNKMRSVDVNDAVLAEYTYNYKGIRTSKITSGNTTHYVIDENRDYAQVLREVVDGQIAVSYSYGHDLIAQERDNDIAFYHYDGLGSTRRLSDAAGVFTSHYNYEAFGEILNQTGSIQNNYLFAGEQLDPSLNQYYLRARYYNQNVGRLTQMDTFLGIANDPITLHKYLYANADPANFIDPSGNVAIGELVSALRIQSNLGAQAVRAAIGTSGGRQVIGRALKATLHFAIGQLIRNEVKRCFRSKGKKCRLPNIFVIGNSLHPESQEHVRDAINGHGSNEARVSPFVTYRLLGRRRASTSWRRSSPECKGKIGRAKGKDCDEFPFLSTRQGGREKYRSGKVSLRPIDSEDNQSSGRVWGRAVGKGKNGANYVVIPWGEFTFFYSHGKFGSGL